MSKRGERIAARARALVGVRFRPQGRSRETGVDCIGLVALSLGLKRVRADYTLQGGSFDLLREELLRARMKPVRKCAVGDVMILKAGFQQLHLAVRTDAGFVHAHAGLRRVVETPGEPEWPVLEVWRGPMRKRAGS